MLTATERENTALERLGPAITVITATARRRRACVHVPPRAFGVWPRRCAQAVRQSTVAGVLILITDVNAPWPWPRRFGSVIAVSVIGPFLFPLFDAASSQTQTTAAILGGGGGPSLSRILG